MHCRMRCWLFSTTDHEAQLLFLRLLFLAPAFT